MARECFCLDRHDNRPGSVTEKNRLPALRQRAFRRRRAAQNRVEIQLHAAQIESAPMTDEPHVPLVRPWAPEEDAALIGYVDACRSMREAAFELAARFGDRYRNYTKNSVIARLRKLRTTRHGIG